MACADSKIRLDRITAFVTVSSLPGGPAASVCRGPAAHTPIQEAKEESRASSGRPLSQTGWYRERGARAVRLSLTTFFRAGARTPEGAEIVAQSEEEAAEAEEEEDAPDGFDLRQVHEEELADDEEKRSQPATDEPGAVESQPGDEEPDCVETPGHADPAVAARQRRELTPQKGEESGMRRDAVHKTQTAGQDQHRCPEGEGYNREVHEGAGVEERRVDGVRQAQGAGDEARGEPESGKTEEEVRRSGDDPI